MTELWLLIPGLVGRMPAVLTPATADSCTYATSRIKTIVVVNLISHKQLCRNSLHSRDKVVCCKGALICCRVLFQDTQPLVATILYFYNAYQA